MSKVSWVTSDGRRIAVDDNTAALLDCLESQHEALLGHLRALMQPSEAARLDMARLGVEPASAAPLDAPELRELLAAYAHNAWSGWMYYLFDKSAQHADGSVTIPASLVERWQRQMKTEYADLSPNEQASDPAEADKMLAIIKEHGAKEPFA